MARISIRALHHYDQIGLLKPAHIGENGRLTIMLCSFDETPTIFRMYGRGEVARMGTPRFEELRGHFEEIPGGRQIILLHLDSAQTSCGFAVPYFEYKGERPTLAGAGLNLRPGGSAPAANDTGVGTMAKNIYEKIWDAHKVAQPEGQSAILYIDRHYVHEVTSPQAFEGLRLTGRKLRRPELTFATMDHNIPTTDRSLPIRDALS